MTSPYLNKKARREADVRYGAFCLAFSDHERDYAARWEALDRKHDLAVRLTSLLGVRNTSIITLRIERQMRELEMRCILMRDARERAREAHGLTMQPV
jgi:hypothetical protein